MVTMYDSAGNPIRGFTDVISYNKSYVAFANNGYRSEVYAADGQYFDNPEEPFPPEPEPQPDGGAQQILDILKGVTE